MPSLAAGLPGPAPASVADARPEPTLTAPVGAPSSDRVRDELDFFDVEADVALDVDTLPAEHRESETSAGKPTRAVRFTPQPMEAVKPPSTAALGEVSLGDQAAEPEPPVPPRERASEPALVGPPSGDPRPGIVAFAGFGIRPEKLSETPGYALRVLARRRVLRAGLEVARARRPRDVDLYQAALAAADDEAVRKGLVLLGALATAALGALSAAVGVLL